MLQSVFSALVVLTLATSGVEAKKQPFIDGQLTFECSDLDGNPVSSSDERFQGKVVLVDLWATWCPPCLTEIPTFVDLQERYGDQGLVIVGIAFERDEQAEARRAKLGRFAGERGINYLILDGGDIGSFEQALPMIRSVSGFPIEIVLDRSGKVVRTANSTGYSKKWARRLEEELGGLLAAAGD